MPRALLTLALLLASSPAAATPPAPGDDFFSYANDAWLAATEIPAGSSRRNARDEINELTRRQVTKLIDDTASAPAGSDARKVADFRAAWLNEAAIGLRGRDAYLSTSPDKAALRTSYQAYIGRVLDLAGFEHATERAQRVMALETAIARSHATPEASADERNADTLWARADFVRHAPGMDWPAFFDAAGLSQQPSFVVWQPSAVKGAAALVASEPLPVWLDYLRFRLIHEHAELLPRAFAEQPPQTGRAQRALEATQQTMSGIVGRLYAERHFPPARKARVQTIAANVIAAFRERVAAVSWLSPSSRKQALEKLQALYFGVGYPEQWQDYRSLVISPADAAGNLQRMAEWDYRNALARLGQPVDRREWWIAPQTSGAVLLFQQNAYNFSAALLQAPKFDPDASDAMNYGAIGAIVGHEASHFVDTLGRKVHWWTDADRAGYEAATAPLIDQFSRYRPFPDVPINGKLTLVENVADLAGLTAAFDAYRRTLGSAARDAEYVKRRDREFFIGFARSWRSKMTDDALRKQAATDDHAPEMFRVSTVRNIDAWYDAFDVEPGQRLYLEPKARVRVW